MKKNRLIQKIMAWQPEKQTIPIKILPNISASKGSHTMSFRQLIGYNIKNIYLEKHTQNAWFLHDFWRKIFPLLCILYWPNFIVTLPLLREILGNMCIVIVSSSGFDVINSKINHIFLIKLFSTLPKIKDKNLIILRTIRTFKMKQRTFFVNFNELTFKQIMIFVFGRWESNFNNAEA